MIFARQNMTFCHLKALQFLNLLLTKRFLQVEQRSLYSPLCAPLFLWICTKFGLFSKFFARILLFVKQFCGIVIIDKILFYSITLEIIIREWKNSIIKLLLKCFLFWRFLWFLFVLNVLVKISKVLSYDCPEP